MGLSSKIRFFTYANCHQRVARQSKAHCDTGLLQGQGRSCCVSCEEAMSKKQITSEKIRQPSGHFSQATTVEARGRLVFISGMTSRRPDGTIAGIGDIEAQTRQVCENLKAAVEAAGGTLANVCRVDVYVRNMENLAPIHKGRREYFPSP